MSKESNLWPEFNKLADRMAKETTHVAGFAYTGRPVPVDTYLLLKCVQDLDQRLRRFEEEKG